MSEVKSFSGLTSKAVTVAKALAPLAGAVQGVLGHPMAEGRGFEGAPGFIIDNISYMFEHAKIANPLLTTKHAMTAPDKYPILSGIGAAIGGLIAQEAGSKAQIGLLSNFGQIMKRYGIAASVSSIIAAWIYLARYNPHGGAASSQGTTTGTNRPLQWGKQSVQPDTLWQSRGGAQFRSAPAPAMNGSGASGR